MASNKKTCIINSAINEWYTTGQQRLLTSLHEVDYTGDVLTWANESINDYYDPACIYTTKAAAFSEAIKQGYEVILWVDAAIYAILHPQPVLDIIERDGGYFIHSGYSLGQTANDYALEYAGISRDRACELPELNTCVFGVDVTSDKGKVFIEYFLQCCKDRVFHGSREHDGQSKDARFLFHRQDQTAGTLAYYRAGFKKIHQLGRHVEFAIDYNDLHQDHVVFLSQGL